MSFERAVVLDTVDIAALGAGSVENEGRLGDRDAKWDSVGVPGRTGEVAVASEPEYAPRILDLRFVLEAASRTALLALRDEIFFRLHPSIAHTFRFVDDEAREVTGFVERIQFPGIGPDLWQDAAEMRVRVKCLDPREYAASDTVVSAIGASDEDLPLGADRSEAVIVVTGAGTFTLTYKNSSGTTIHTLDIAGATAPVTIDMQTGSITDGDGEAADHLVSPSSFPFSFDPLHGDFPTAAWPTLACSAGSAEATYRKAY